MEPRYIEPLYDEFLDFFFSYEFLDVTNHYGKIYEKNLDKTRPRYKANKSVGLLILSLKFNSWGVLLKMITM